MALNWVQIVLLNSREYLFFMVIIYFVFHFFIYVHMCVFIWWENIIFKRLFKGIFAFYCCERLCKNRLNELIDACWGMMMMAMTMTMIFFLFDCRLSVYMNDLLELLPFLCAYSKREYAHNLCSKIDRQMIMMWSIHDQVLSDRGSHNYFLSFFFIFFFFCLLYSWEVGIKQLFWILISFLVMVFSAKGKKI